MAAGLVVWLEDVAAGDLSEERGTWRFGYRDAWLERPGGYALSPHLPLRREAFEDTADDRRVQWFFDNLLPEGGIREALARSAGIDERDTYGMLARFGEESVGAVTLLAGDHPGPATGTYEPLTVPAIRDLLRGLPEVPLIAAGGRAKMSLAGVQHKIGVHRQDDHLLLPVGGAASSMILKPGHVRPQSYPHVPANEHFCMSWAREMGLDVPGTELLHVPESLYLVHRFDRVVVAGRVQRRHQIDLCQVLNRWPGFKYEAGGGATLRTVFEAIEGTRQPAVARLQALRWVVLNYLMGNSDAHAKNLSFLVGPDGMALAPAYDLLCVTAYGDPDMAMSIGDQIRYGWVTSDDWDAFATTVGVRESWFRRLRLELAERGPVVARRLLEREDFRDDERAFLGKVMVVIDTHAAYILGQSGAVP